MNKVQVNTKGIKNRLKAVKPCRAISEYIWNGFDAGATQIDIRYVSDALRAITDLSITDNGSGIQSDELVRKFVPILASEKKSSEQINTLIHGKNGLGRLTFFHISQKVEFKTIYKDNLEFYFFSIEIDSSSLDNFSRTNSEISDTKEVGTVVSFINILPEISVDYFNSTILNYLKKEFCFFLEMKKTSGISIKINDSYLEYDDIIKDTENGIIIQCGDHEFNCDYVRWLKKPNSTYSRYYCIDNQDLFRFSKPTTFNNKGDEFYHSIYIKSGFFNNFEAVIDESNQNELIEKQNNLSHQTFKDLIKKIESFLENKRNPFLLEYSQYLVDKYEKEGVFPKYEKKNEWEKIKADELRETIKRLYQIEPKIFHTLNITQKKTFVAFINLIMDGGELEKVFDIMSCVVELTPEDRNKLCNQLKITKLSSIIKTIELISDRYKAVEHFKTLVFDPSMYAGEIPHLQKMMEKNYWLLGEEYMLLSAAEPKFEEVLRRFSYVLHGDTEGKSINHPDKNKEMDLLIIRQDKRNDIIENIVAELKHPINVKLGKKELDQIYAYFSLIKSEHRFNGSNIKWKFFLIGNEFDSSGYIENQISNMRVHGEAGLAFRSEYDVYVKRWSEIFTEFELRHNFLNERLELEKHKLIVDEHLSASDIINLDFSSDSKGELKIPRSKLSNPSNTFASSSRIPSDILPFNP